jgi:sarcosine oxidase
LSLSQTVRPPTEQLRGRRRWDVIVVGCGVTGASVSYNLAKKGLNVLTIERFGVNHQFGSSHGKTRIIRTAYYEDPRYVPLLKRAFESWRDVESKSGKKLLQLTGGLMIGRPEGELVSGVLRSAKTHDLPHQVLSAKEAEERFEAFSLREDFQAFYEENAGVLFAEDCVRALVGLGSEAGCEFRFSEQVSGWKRTPEGFEVETKGGTHGAARLVLCAGPWTGKLLSGLLPLQVERQVPIWFSSGGQEKFSPPKMPIFIAEEDTGALYYGVPDFGDGVKVAQTHGGELTDPDAVKRVVSEQDIARVRQFISERLRGLDDNPVASTTCLYTNTPDLNFVVGPHPSHPNMTIVSACSGHGFKFASVLGEVVADMAIEGKTRFDVEFLSPKRFVRSGS